MQPELEILLHITVVPNDRKKFQEEQQQPAPNNGKMQQPTTVIQVT